MSIPSDSQIGTQKAGKATFLQGLPIDVILLLLFTWRSALEPIEFSDELPMAVEQVSRFYRPQLDVVRFCAFLAVFGHHTLPRSGPYPKILTVSVDALGFGLSLFFVLSAYLITLLLVREREATGSIHLAAFYKRRVLRIWPLYLLGILIGVFRAYNHGVLDQQKTWFIAALLLSGNLVYPGTILMSHLWSISIEEQFYLFFPSACRSFGRRGMFLFALLLIAVANITLVHFAHGRANLDVQVWFSSFVQFEMFAAGILLALADDLLPRWNTLFSALAIVGSVSLWILAAGFFHLKTMDATAKSAGGLCLGYVVVAMACCLFLVAAQGLPSPKPLVYSGRISYGLYVFHIPAIALISARVSSYTAGVFLSLIATYGLAAASYHYYEMPFLQWKRRFELIPTRTA